MQSVAEPHVSTVSLDYDGCAYILFEQNRESILSFMFNLLTLKPQLKAFVEENEAHLKLKIQEFISVIKDRLQSSIDECFNQTQRRILLVGSNRQDPAIDLLNSVMNKNHLCFKLFREYSEQHGLEFCELLLGDIYHLQGHKREEMLPIGTTMKTDYPDIPENTSKERLKEILYPFCLSPAFPNKSLLIQTQIDHIAKINTAENDKILFVFFDDRLELIDDVVNNVSIPDNIVFKTIHFDTIKQLGSLILQEIRTMMVTNPLKRTPEESQFFPSKKEKITVEKESIPESKFSNT